MTDTNTAQDARATVTVVQNYLARLTAGDPVAAASHVSDTLDWLGSDTHALRLTHEHATVAGHEHRWQRAVLFSVDGAGRISRVQRFEDDQYSYEDWLGGRAPEESTGLDSLNREPDGPAQAVDGAPQMSGDLDDSRVRAVLSYQRQVAAGDLESARAIFWPDVTYTVPGRGLLAGTYRGPDEVMGYFGRLFALTDGTYTISRMHWLTSPDRVALATRNAATRQNRSLSWDELIVFTFVDGRKKEIIHFSGDQYGVDQLFS